MIINNDVFHNAWNMALERQNRAPIDSGEKYYMSGVLDAFKYMYENKLKEANEEGIATPDSK